MDQLPDNGRQHDLEPGDCLLLLAMQEVGRLVTAGTPPQVRPVNFVVVEGCLYVRTDAALPHDDELSFEVDQVDAAERQGWSVVLHGRARSLQPDEVPAQARERLQTWAPGDKSQWSMIEIHEITGRWVRAGRPHPSLDRRGYL